LTNSHKIGIFQSKGGGADISSFSGEKPKAVRNPSQGKKRYFITIACPFDYSPKSTGKGLNEAKIRAKV
jgi:hypothetical protein